MKLRSIFAITFILLLSANSFAGTWVAPNEHYPIIGKAIFDQSNHGTYLSVGSERSFMGAAYTKAQALYVIDLDPDVVKFAYINRALLHASHDRTDYVFLRLRASVKDWKVRGVNMIGEDQGILQDLNNWKWWRANVREENGWHEGFQKMAHKPKNSKDPFFGFNYLFDDSLFTQLKQLADNNLIFSRVA